MTYHNNRYNLVFTFLGLPGGAWKVSTHIIDLTCKSLLISFPSELIFCHSQYNLETNLDRYDIVLTFIYVLKFKINPFVLTLIVDLILISQQFGSKDKPKDIGKPTSLVGKENFVSLI